jgi:4-amino-4-deoxy-L-arabinose transferase-like glycosyltransferase
MTQNRPVLSRFDFIFWLIMLVATFLLFYGLDHRPFWQDEAETACLAKNVLQYGVPKAFDGVNLISQEQGKEFNTDYLWRWSPWLQIYVAAAAFRLGGLTTEAGRFPFALAGLACIAMVYLLIKQRFGDLAWARLAAALLTFSVPFLLFSRQCRYYSLGMLLALLILYAFGRNWQSKITPAALLVGSLVLMFHTNYLLFFSYTIPLFLVAILLYRQEMSLRRTILLALSTFILLIPFFFFYRIEQQSGMIDITLIPGKFIRVFADLFQFMIPLPLVVFFIWRWRKFLINRTKPPEAADERFALFLFLVILGNVVFLSISPQYYHRYVIHLYPLCMILLAWLCVKVGRRIKFAGIILGFLLIFTNYLYIVPMDLLLIPNRPKHNDIYMLTSPNIPIKLYLTELFSNYPDINRGLIQFFQTRSKRGDTILATYSDLPLQFYTSFKIMGGLQGRPLEAERSPDWVVYLKRYTKSGQTTINNPVKFIQNNLKLNMDYERIKLPYPDDYYGNRPDPYFHHFVIPTNLPGYIEIYQKK